MSLAGCGPQPPVDGRTALASVGTGQRPQLAPNNSRRLGPCGLSAEAGHPENAAPALGVRWAKPGEGNYRDERPTPAPPQSEAAGDSSLGSAKWRTGSFTCVVSTRSCNLQQTVPRVSESAFRACACAFDV